MKMVIMVHGHGDVAFHPSEVRNLIEKHANAKISTKVFAKCPKCEKSAGTKVEVEKLFGFRNMDGFVRVQSYCRDCRSTKAKSKTLEK